MSSWLQKKQVWLSGKLSEPIWIGKTKTHQQRVQRGGASVLSGQEHAEE